MRLFAIGDLHLSGGDDKPMDVFAMGQAFFAYQPELA